MIGFRRYTLQVYKYDSPPLFRDERGDVPNMQCPQYSNKCAQTMRDSSEAMSNRCKNHP